MVKFSTGTVQGLAKYKTLKEQFNDGVLRIYSGSQPANADATVNGTLLFEVTLNGGTFAAGTKSTAEIDKIVVGSSTEGHTFAVSVGGATYTYTALAGSSTTIVATGLAALINESDVVSAVSSGADIIVRARFAGVAFTLAEETDTGTLTLSTLVANARAQGIQFGSASDGVLSKETGDWEGAAIVGGTAAWFRICGNAADLTGSSSTLPRIDGSCSTTSGDMVLRTLTIVAADPIVITQCDITIPKVRT